MAFRNFRLFFQGNHIPLFVKFHHPIGTRVFHVIAEDAGSFLHTCRPAKHGGESLSVEHIIAKNQTARFAVQKVGSQDESLCQSVGLLLNLIGKGHSQFLTRPQQVAEHRQVTWSRDNQHLAYACQHQCGQRIVNHRLVIHRHNLFGNRFGKRIKACSTPSGKNNSFHVRLS